MKKLFKKSVFVWIFVSVHLIGCTKQSLEINTPLSLEMGLSADYPPFEFKKNGQIMGFDVDLAQEISKELGYPLSIKDMDFSSLIPALQSGRIDFIMSGLSATEERRKNMDFSHPYFINALALVVPIDSLFHREEDFQNKKIGAQLGSTMEKFAKETASHSLNMQVIALGKNPLLIQELKSGRLDGIIFETVQAFAFVQANPALKVIPLKSGDSYNENMVAFSKSNHKHPQLKEQFNLALEKLKNNGTLEKIKSKWIGHPSND